MIDREMKTTINWICILLTGARQIGKKIRECLKESKHYIALIL